MNIPNSMSKQAQVYIATTQGLVHIQAITALGDAQLGQVPNNLQTLRSMVTINRTVKVAGISQDYAAFVEPAQGIIQTIFGGQAYRLNIDNAIDVGNSWQLGVYLAHALHANGHLSQLSNSQGNTAENDTIFIASGAINTLDLSVIEVSALVQKTLTSSAQIQQWQAQGKSLYFLIPKANFKQVLPDLTMPVTAIESIEQLHQLLKALDFGEQPLLANVQDDVISEHVNHAVVQDNDPLVIEALPTKKSRTFTLFVLLAAFGLCALTIMLLMFGNGKQSRPDMAFQMQAMISANKVSCELADTQTIKTGHFGNLQKIQPTRLQHLCTLFLQSSTDIKHVWLVSNSGKVLTLDSVDAKSSSLWQQQKQWHIPMPSNQNSNRSYLLLAFTATVDAADKQSLEHYLQQLYSSKATSTSTPFYTHADMLLWAQKVNVPVYFLSHELFI